MSDREDVAQMIWQTYAVETGSALPPGLADKLADAAIEAMSDNTVDVLAFQEAEVQRTVATDTTKRGTRLPEDWMPSPDVQHSLTTEYPHLALGKILAEFRDYWCAVPGSRGLKLSWDRTFRNRVREVAHKPQYRVQSSHVLSRVDTKAMGYLSD